ncbi:MAG TPA: hypothetical protein VHG09_09980 [Longimicrobiales bacterium]|nr:hypothetical protein [Longimicrobiales bacterium]
MAVRDLLWGCPLCRAPGSIRPDRKRERCRQCGAEFRRSAGARVTAERDGVRVERAAGEWLDLLGPAKAPAPDANGIILGPEQVSVKLTRRQDPLEWAGQLIGWIEVYTRPRMGILSMRDDGLHFQPNRGDGVYWGPADLTGLQPASSSLQLGLHGHMAAVKFLEGSVRLWTRALSDLLLRHYRAQGRAVLELQPCVRTCLMRSAS